MFRFICSALIVAVSAAASANAQAPQPPRPDLTIVNAVKVPGGDVRVFIKNQGTANAAACKMSVKLFSPAGALLGERSVFVQPIAVGLTMSISTPVGNLAPGSRVELKVDFTNVLVESNELNNARRLIIPNIPF